MADIDSPGTVVCRGEQVSERGRAVRFRLIADGEARPAFVVRVDGQVRAFINRCGHLAMELDWETGAVFDAQGRFLICATHGARYDPASGRCVSGRCAGRGLEAVAVEEVSGEVRLAGHDAAGVLPDGGEE